MLVGSTYDFREEHLLEGYREEDIAELDRPDMIDPIDAALLRAGPPSSGSDGECRGDKERGR